MTTGKDRRGFLVSGAAGVAGLTAGSLARPASATADDYSGALPFTLRAATEYAGNTFEVRRGDELRTSINSDGRISRHNTGPGHAPFVWEVGTVDFTNGATTIGDPVSYFGYNIGLHGVPLEPSEPFASYVLEADYLDPNGRRNIEMYIEAQSTKGERVRPWFFQLKRDAAAGEPFITSAYIMGNPFNVLHPDGSKMAEFYKHRAKFSGRVLAASYATNGSEAVSRNRVGSIVRRLPIFDENGVRLGYTPIYNTID
jgi:hypothetical protein